MKTRLFVSAMTIGALSLGSISAFAQDYRHDGDHRGDRQAYVQRAPDGDAHARREWREHERREHAWRGYQQAPGYVYQQPGYVYAPPSTYQDPGYVYQPGYAYAPPSTYQDPSYAYRPEGYVYQPQGYYVQPDGSDAAFGAIVGGIIGAAIAANH